MVRDGNKNRDRASQWIQYLWFQLKDTLIEAGYFDLKNEDDWKAINRVTQAVLTFTQDLRNR